MSKPISPSFASLVQEFFTDYMMRISAIVDAQFSLIVDGKSVPGRTCRGGMQVLGLNVAQSSTIRLKRSGVARSRGSGRAATWCP